MAWYEGNSEKTSHIAGSSAKVASGMVSRIGGGQDKVRELLGGK